VAKPAVTVLTPTLNAEQYSLESMRAAIERAFFDEPLRRSLIERGRARAEFFSCDRCADETLARYRSLW
jgi:glycosyltransferase involved in cell wall biosynthesis